MSTYYFSFYGELLKIILHQQIHNLVVCSLPSILPTSSLGLHHLSHLMTKPTKWSVLPTKTQINLGIHQVWSESLLCALWVAKDPRCLHADSEDSDQTGRMPRLIWVFARRTDHFIGFVMQQLICIYCKNPKSSDTQKNCCNIPKLWMYFTIQQYIQQKMQKEWQTVWTLIILRCSLIWVYAICPELSVNIVRIIMVSSSALFTRHAWFHLIEIVLERDLRPKIICVLKQNKTVQHFSNLKRTLYFILCAIKPTFLTTIVSCSSSVLAFLGAGSPSPFSVVSRLCFFGTSLKCIWHKHECRNNLV